MSKTSEAPPLSTRYTEAFQLAFEVHAGQYRKGTSIPYLAHVMSVSALVLEAGGDEDCAIAGLLHDAVEDASDGVAILESIRRQFGNRVAGIVRACSDTVAVPGEDKLPWRERKERYIRHLQSADTDSLLVSSSDKLHNARAIVSDMRAIGNAVWERFNTKSGTDQIWYYQSLCDAFAARGEVTWFSALSDVVAELTMIGSELGIATREQCSWASHNTAPRSHSPISDTLIRGEIDSKTVGAT